MSQYHKYEARRSLYFLDPGSPESFTGEVAADKGLQVTDRTAHPKSGGVTRRITC